MMCKELCSYSFNSNINLKVNIIVFMIPPHTKSTLLIPKPVFNIPLYGLTQHMHLFSFCYLRYG